MRQIGIVLAGLIIFVFATNYRITQLSRRLTELERKQEGK